MDIMYFHILHVLPNVLAERSSAGAWMTAYKLVVLFVAAYECQDSHSADAFAVGGGTLQLAAVAAASRIINACVFVPI